jgi:hypothetical protein
MRVTIPILALALSTALAPAHGQQSSTARWTPELRPFVGTIIPAGQLRDVIGSETQFGLQVAGELRPWLHVLGTASWTPATTRYVASDRTLRVLQYDVGAEVNGRQELGGPWDFLPFWGAGLGARTYLYDAGELNDRTCFAGYVSTGFEVQNGPVGLRTEGRANAFCYRSPVAGEASGTRADLGLTFGLVYHFR